MAATELQAIVRFRFHDGSVEAFKRLSAQCMDIVINEGSTDAPVRPIPPTYAASMAVMFLAVDEVTDLPLFREYQVGARPVLAEHPCELVAYDEEAQPLERVETTKRVIALRFPSREAFHAFYDSPEYQAVIGKRLESTSGFALLLDVADAETS